MTSKYPPTEHMIYYSQQVHGRKQGASNRGREEQSLNGIFNYFPVTSTTSDGNMNSNNNNDNAYPKSLSPQKDPKVQGLATNVRAHNNYYPSSDAIPTSYGAGVPSSLRNDGKNRLANEYGKTEYYPFDEKRSLVHPTGPAKVPDRRPDNAIFVPKLDPQPARRLHNIAEEYLKQIWEEDTRKENAAVKMEKNIAGSPINELRRGGNENPFGRPQEPLWTETQLVRKYDQQHQEQTKLSPRQNITELQNKQDPVHGCRHFAKMYKTNFELGPEEIRVSAGRRKNEGYPQVTKAVVY